MKHLNAIIFLVSAMALSISCNQNTSQGDQTATTELARKDTPSGKAVQMNILSEEEGQEGWKLLFDGESTDGWRGAYKDSFPEKGWIVEDGVLTVLPSGGAESAHGGDIITEDEYSSFELTLEFKITEGANSGIKYFVVEKTPKPKGSAIGLEYQILDDEKHPDAKKGKTATGP